MQVPRLSDAHEDAVPRSIHGVFQVSRLSLGTSYLSLFGTWDSLARSWRVSRVFTTCRMRPCSARASCFHAPIRPFRRRLRRAFRVLRSQKVQARSLVPRTHVFASGCAPRAHVFVEARARMATSHAPLVWTRGPRATDTPQQMHPSSREDEGEGGIGTGADAPLFLSRRAGEILGMSNERGSYTPSPRRSTTRVPSPEALGFNRKVLRV